MFEMFFHVIVTSVTQCEPRRFCWGKTLYKWKVLIEILPHRSFIVYMCATFSVPMLQYILNYVFILQIGMIKAMVKGNYKPNWHQSPQGRIPVGLCAAF